MPIYQLTTKEIDRLNPQDRDIIYIDCVQWSRIYEQTIEDDNWLPVGYIPVPKHRIGWFFYHLIHGIWMRYPLWKVVLYAVFESKIPGEAKGVVKAKQA